MIEIQGNLWDFYGRPNTIVLVTTNGSICRNGCAADGSQRWRGVMGRGCAAQAHKRFPNIESELGELLHRFGNEIHTFSYKGIWSFPVKHIWNDAASLPLIRKSTLKLQKIALSQPDERFILPRPGCGYGHRLWIEVEPIVRILPDNVLVISYAR